MSRNTTKLTTRSPRPTAPEDPLVTLSQLHEELRAQDRHLEGTLSNIQEYHAAKYHEINSRFDAVDGRFDVVDSRFNAVDSRFDAVYSRFNAIAASLEHAEQRAEVRSGNRLSTRLFHPIRPVKVRGKTPDHFPRKVGAFCKLRRQENLPALASLLEAYEFTDWEDWEEDDDSEGQLKLRRDDQTVAEFYVERYPKAAHFELATKIGLDYTAIKDEMERFEDHDESPIGGILAKRKEREDVDSSFGRARPEYMSITSSLTEEIHRGPTGNYKQAKLSSTAETGHTTTSQETDDLRNV